MGATANRRQTTMATSSWSGAFWVILPAGDDEPHGDWQVAYRIAQQGTQLVIAEIRISPWPATREEEEWLHEARTDPDVKDWLYDDGSPALRVPDVPEGGLTTRATRGIRTGEALERARRQVMHGIARTLPGFSAEALDDARWRIRTDRLLTEVSAVYVEVLDSHAPIRELTRRLADQGAHYAEATVRDLVNEARNRGLLTRPPKGRAGGQLTEKAQQLLS